MWPAPHLQRSCYLYRGLVTWHSESMKSSLLLDLGALVYRLRFRWTCSVHHKGFLLLTPGLQLLRLLVRKNAGFWRDWPLWMISMSCRGRRAVRNCFLLEALQILDLGGIIFFMRSQCAWLCCVFGNLDVSWTVCSIAASEHETPVVLIWRRILLAKRHTQVCVDRVKWGPWCWCVAANIIIVLYNQRLKSRILEKKKTNKLFTLLKRNRDSEDSTAVKKLLPSVV